LVLEITLLKIRLDLWLAEYLYRWQWLFVKLYVNKAAMGCWALAQTGRSLVLRQHIGVAVYLKASIDPRVFWVVPGSRGKLHDPG